MSDTKYTFNPITHCNMCGAESANHKVLGKRLNHSQGKNPKSKTGVCTTIVKCKSCGLVFSNPIPIPVNIQDHYGIPPEEYWKSEYFIVNESDFAYVIEKAKQLIDFKLGMKSLDCGAGIGKSMIAFKNAGFDAYGFEASEPFYKRGIEKMKISPEKLQLGMIENVEFPNDYFDLITFKAVLEHFYNPSQSITKALKWLKPNGVIKIDVPSSDWLIAKLMNFYYKLKFTDYVSNLSPMHEPFHLYEFSENSFKKHGIKNNYQIIETQYSVCETFMPKILDKPLKFIMRKTNTGMDITVWIRKNL